MVCHECDTLSSTPAKAAQAPGAPAEPSLLFFVSFALLTSMLLSDALAGRWLARVLLPLLLGGGLMMLRRHSEDVVARENRAAARARTPGACAVRAPASGWPPAGKLLELSDEVLGLVLGFVPADDPPCI